MKPKLFLSTALAISLACAFLPSTFFGASAQQTVNRDVGVDALTIKDAKGVAVKLYEKSYALVIGASEYTAGWSKLPGVKRDVEAVSVALERHGFQVTVEMNPTAERLEKSIKDFIAAHGMNVENRLLIYFAGHGHTLKQSYGDEMGYIVPVDAPRPEGDANLAAFRTKALSMRRVELYAEEIQAKHALFLFDSCFSGSLFVMRSGAVPESISSKTALPVRQFITSGSAEEKVPDESIFRKEFVEAIEGAADKNPKDGYVTGSELGGYLYDKVTNSSRNPQHPQFGTIRNTSLNKGDFVFSLKREAARVIPKNPKPGMVVTGAASIELVYIPPGSFMMGSENGRETEKPVHRVTIQEGFWMGKYEVTQVQWQQVVARDRSQFEGDNLPVENVSWDNTQEFIKKLNEMNDGFIYRLPTEAEWEYACRARTTDDYAGNLDAMAWYASNSDNKTHVVGGKQANGFGLYDMHGNVWEWCEDVWHENYSSALTDGTAWLSGGDSSRRVLRGGSWYNYADDLRSASRIRLGPESRINFVGFRVVAVPRQ